MGDNNRRLAVVYDPLSVDALQFSRAGDDWHTIWLLDRATYPTGDAERVLRRLGSVADITGLDPDAAATLVSDLRPDGIMAFSDGELPRTSRLARSLGLPFFSADVVERLVNKAEQRRALAAAGLAVPAFIPLPAGFEPAVAAETVNHISFPVIVKPQVGASSRNTHRVGGRGDLVVALRALASEPSGVIIEELLADRWPREDRPYADYVSVESALSHARISHVMVTGRPTLAEPFRETGAFMPALLSDADERAVLDTASAAITAMGAQAGAFHTEIKLTPAGPRVIEVNGRLGGRIAELLDAAGGVSLLAIAVRVALGCEVEVAGPVDCRRVSYLLEVQAPASARRLLRIDGLQSLLSLPGVANVRSNRSPGDTLDWRDGTGGHLFGVDGTAPDHDAMWRVWEQIYQTPTVVYE